MFHSDEWNTHSELEFKVEGLSKKRSLSETEQEEYEQSKRKVSNFKLVPLKDNQEFLSLIEKKLEERDVKWKQELEERDIKWKNREQELKQELQELEEREKEWKQELRNKDKEWRQE
nr:unnamed protein product [Naegleria fowleri]